jgi:prepilin-type processing-associated H-X9-DG protein
MKQKIAGIAFWEYLVIIFTFALLAAVLAPVVVRRGSHIHGSCLSNLKQVGLAFLQYAQDNDDCLPPVAGEREMADGTVTTVSWGPFWQNLPATQSPKDDPGFIMPYIRSYGVFSCPQVVRDAHRPGALQYMYNDLAALQNQAKMPGIKYSILVAEGEDQRANFGHAWMPDSEIFPGAANAQGYSDANQGATVKDAPRRHNGGANYLFADGHAKWYKPEGIFFPDRRVNYRSHTLKGQLLGPDPGGDMKFDTVQYDGTFHVK